jgi:dipeptidyl-peptidase-4
MRPGRRAASRFPAQYARTARFTLGVARRFTVSPDGARVVFCRSISGSDPMTCLYALDVETGAEHVVADPRSLRVDESLHEELVRRERMREPATGLTAYATDRSVDMAAFALGGRLWAVDLDGEPPHELPTVGPVVDPRPSPSGDVIAYVSDGALRILFRDGSGDRALAVPEGPNVVYGLPEHVAAEEMNRLRGYWWAPSGDRLIVARVDNSPVETWYVSDPANPTTSPVAMRYPSAGTANADVTLWIADLDGVHVAVDWDRQKFEYVSAVNWDQSDLLVVVQNRSQTLMRILAVDSSSGKTRVVREDQHETWVPIIGGLPAHLDRGELVWTADVAGTRHLLVNGVAITPPELQVHEVFDVYADTVLFSASHEPTEIPAWTWNHNVGLRRLTNRPGVHRAVGTQRVTVITSESLDYEGTRVTVTDGTGAVHEITSVAEHPVLTPRAHLFSGGERELRIAVLLPHWYTVGKLPVLMDPYGGPGGQRVLSAQSAYLVSQWFADQGFVVVVADGRGTPGRGPEWERAIYLDEDGLALEDQMVALRAAATRYPQMDLSRVGIRGWSFGGTLAAMAVLRKPDVFHAAVAGAAVTDQLLSSTHWQERYLGHPDEHPDVYRRRAPITYAADLQRPLMLIHGLADDNVFPVHTMRLSAALLVAGRPHTVLPLTGTGHMASQQGIADNMLILQAEFFKRSLG